MVTTPSLNKKTYTNNAPTPKNSYIFIAHLINRVLDYFVLLVIGCIRMSCLKKIGYSLPPMVLCLMCISSIGKSKRQFSISFSLKIKKRYLPIGGLNRYFIHANLKRKKRCLSSFKRKKMYLSIYIGGSNKHFIHVGLKRN